MNVTHCGTVYTVEFDENDMNWFLNQWPLSKHWPSPGTATRAYFVIDSQTGNIESEFIENNAMGKLGLTCLRDYAMLFGAMELGLDFVLDRWPNRYQLFVEERMQK